MKNSNDRRAFLRQSLTGVAVSALAATRPPRAAAQQPAGAPAKAARIRFAAIGLNHGHINGQTDSVKRGGGWVATLNVSRTCTAEVGPTQV